MRSRLEATVIIVVVCIGALAGFNQAYFGLAGKERIDLELLSSRRPFMQSYTEDREYGGGVAGGKLDVEGQYVGGDFEAKTGMTERQREGGEGGGRGGNGIGKHWSSVKRAPQLGKGNDFHGEDNASPRGGERRRGADKTKMDPLKLCDGLGMSGRGVRRCRGSKEVAPFLLKAFLLSVAHCHRQLLYDRWNCSLGKARRKILRKGFPEAAFLLAISSASVTHVISKGCSTGRLSRCSCDDSAPAPENVRTWRWGGCGDNVKFGSKFSRKLFRRGRSKRKLRDLDFRAQVDQHNVEVGIRLVKDQATKFCKCHGVSGSCAIQTCWKQLASFEQASSTLRDLYHNAVMVSPSNVAPTHSGQSRRGRRKKDRKGSRRRISLSRMDKTKGFRRFPNSKRRLRTEEAARRKRRSGADPLGRESRIPVPTGKLSLGANDASEGKVYGRIALWGGYRHSLRGVSFSLKAPVKPEHVEPFSSGQEGLLSVNRIYSVPYTDQNDSKKHEFLEMNDGRSNIEEQHDVLSRNPRGVPTQPERTQGDVPLSPLAKPQVKASTTMSLAHLRAPEEVVRKKDRDLGPLSSYSQLLFVEKSQDFCRPSTYGPGTSGRECRKGRNCQELCCGRGYNTLLKNRTEACKCQVLWCCEVKCQTCVEQEEVYVCK